MATNSSFVELSHNEIDEFCEQQENDNTTQKALYDIDQYLQGIYFSVLQYRIQRNRGYFAKRATADLKKNCFGCTKERR